MYEFICNSMCNLIGILGILFSVSLFCFMVLLHSNLIVSLIVFILSLVLFINIGEEITSNINK